ncbi:MAG: mandelate racemase/muconate lactonizing enzyme family protein [Planctomycetota bacterium]|nr:MAG: mandelate racemase/muconate lactonizing enzyme family protein [Planctomycetota bacterium]
MNITRIRTHHVRCRLEEPFGFSQWYYDTRNSLLVEIETSDGTVGWGECYGPAAVYQAAIASHYGPLLIGEPAVEVDRLWHKMWQASLDFARGGVMMGAMSGLDMALWDLKGKLLGRSVSELLGGRYRNTVEAYATGMYFVQTSEDRLLDAICTEAQTYWARGFRAMKIKVGKNPAFDHKLIAAVREAVPDAVLMADANHAYSLSEALDIGRTLAEFGYTWFEEPLAPDHEHLFKTLQDSLSIAVAAGECEQTRYGFRRLLSTGGVRIAQPDLAYCGGISEAVKIRTLASALGVDVLPHCWGTMLNLASAVHFLATTYCEPGRAEMPEVLLELDRTPNPLRDELFAVPLAIEGNKVHVPTAPGLGVEVDRNKLTEFEVSQTETC